MITTELRFAEIVRELTIIDETCPYCLGTKKKPDGSWCNMCHGEGVMIAIGTIVDGTCPDCGGSGKVPDGQGGEKPCKWCGGTGEEQGYRDQDILSPILASGSHQNITCSTCHQSMCPTCDASKHGPGKCD